MRLRVLGAALLFAGVEQSSFGASITNGSFDIAGTIFVTQLEATAVVTPAGTCPANTSCIFWQDGAGTNGKVEISSAGLPNGNIPLAISGNDAGNLFILTNPPVGVGGTGFSPVSFMTFNNAGITTDLMLNFIDSGFYPSTDCTLPPAVGQVCTPPGSLFNFVNNAPANGQATASWVFQGVTDTLG